MLTLFHQPLCPHSRYVRLILGEYGIDARLVEERFWERREEFLLLNPAGEIPVLVADGQPAVPGAAIIAEYIEETQTGRGADRLLPAAAGERVEVRRLASWFNDKFHAEVSGPLVTERVFKRHMTLEQGGGAARYRGACAPPATISAIIWPISAGWCARATGSPATG